MNKEFYIGQIFEGNYPPEAAIWCNMNDAKLVFLEEENKITIVSAKEPIVEEEHEDEHQEEETQEIKKTKKTKVSK